VSAPLATVPVGVVVERTKAESRWIDFLWRPVAVLAGQPAAEPWTKLDGDGERTTFYAGPAVIQLHHTETASYRDNLATGAPALWVVLRETGSEPPYGVFMVTADPAEGEAMTEAGNDLVESVPMVQEIRDLVAAFVAEHHVEQAFVKRKRDRANPDSLGRRPPTTPRDDE
jgi:Protein of unknown function (DUF3305)